MNEAGAESTLTLLTEDNVKLDEYIKSCIADAVSIIIQNSPFRCVNKKSGVATLTNNGNTGYITLPDDFISLIAFKINSWKRMCGFAYPIDSEEYRSQSDYTMNGINKPICFISYSNTGQILLYYAKGTKNTDAIETFVYEAKYNSTDGISLNSSDPLAQAVCYMTASLVYSIFENINTAKEMQTIAINLISKK